MLKYFFLSFVFLTIVGCNKNKNTDNENYQIYNVVFDKSIGKSSMWRKKAKGSLFWLNNSIKTREDSLKNNSLLKWIDSTNNVIDTANLYVIIDDTLISKISMNLPFEMIFQNNQLLKKDTTFISILKPLFSSSSSSSSSNIEIIEKSKIGPKENYKLVDNQYNLRNEFKEVGTLSFSKISYNNSKDKACVYTSLICGELCGNGRIFFLEKIKGHWIILDYKNLWIS